MDTLKPLAYSVAWVFLIFAAAWNVLVVCQVSSARDFLPSFLLSAFTAPIALLAGVVAFSAIQIGTENKPFAKHPILSVLALINVGYPAGRLTGLF